MKRKIMAILLAGLMLLLPLAACAEEATETIAAESEAVVSQAETAAEGVKTVFHIDGPAFVDSLQYMLRGMVGIFLVTAIIILAVVILEKATKKKEP